MGSISMSMAQSAYDSVQMSFISEYDGRDVETDIQMLCFKWNTVFDTNYVNRGEITDILMAPLASRTQFPQILLRLCTR